MIKVDIKKIKYLTDSSIKDLAEKVGIHHQTLSDLKSKEAPKQIKYLYDLSKLAGVSMNDLIIDDEQ